MVVTLKHRPSAVARLAALATAGLAFLIPITTQVQAAPAQAAVEVTPHRAVYKMSLSSARNSSKVADVRGRMLFEWGDACDGWTVEQRFQLRFLYAEGDEMQMVTNYVTWEAKDGLGYRFNIRKLVNGELDEEVKGNASLKADGSGGTARFTKPEAAEHKLPAGTVFPTHHTLSILENASTGEKFFARTVFDGAEDDGLTEISTVIGATTEAKAKLDDNPLLRLPAYPVRLAFFPTQSDNPAPEYEMSMVLLRNGIAESMQIDYGDFTVKAILEKLEALPKGGC